MPSIKVLRIIKITPGLVARFVMLPARQVENPCLYCPGICIASCPTYTSTGNLALSPLGYSRDKQLAVEKCLKCWRCSFDCPLNFPLPETFEEKPVKLTLEFKKMGRPMLVSLEGLDEELGTKLAEKYLWGLAVVRGIDERYSVGKPVDKSSLKNILRQLKPFDPIGLSPESAHGLGIRFLLEKPEVLPRITYTGKIHIPCLLTQKSKEIIHSLQKLGVTITGVDVESCIKTGCKDDTLYLCPRAKYYGGTTLFELLF